MTDATANPRLAHCVTGGLTANCVVDHQVVTLPTMIRMTPVRAYLRETLKT